MSLDCHPLYPILATAGMDCTVKFWRFSDPHAAAEGSGGGGAGAGGAAGAAAAASAMDFRFTLSCHNKTVNVVRWSPNGDAIASAGDEGK